jgi:hypothetical protein
MHLLKIFTPQNTDVSTANILYTRRELMKQCIDNL